MKKYLLCISMLGLTACGHTNDYWGPWANCQNLNLRFGFEQYDQCVEAEKIRMSEEAQQEEFRKLEQFQHDLKSATN